MTSSSQRAEEKRKDKLAVVQEQIDAGTLKVRKMTAKERKANPPRPRPERGRGSKRRFA
jgi:hypothetical protein